MQPFAKKKVDGVKKVERVNSFEQIKGNSGTPFSMKTFDKFSTIAKKL